MNHDAPSTADLDQTVRQARVRLKDERAEGTTCPCCEQRVEEYRRHITPAMGRVLIMMHRTTDPGEAVSVPNLIETYQKPSAWRGDYTKLRHWGLIEAGDGKGVWAITSQGRAFVQGHVKLHTYKVLYRNRVVEGYGPKVGIEQVIDVEGPSLRSLMTGRI